MVENRKEAKKPIRKSEEIAKASVRRKAETAGDAWVDVDDGGKSRRRPSTKVATAGMDEAASAATLRIRVRGFLLCLISLIPCGEKCHFY